MIRQQLEVAVIRSMLANLRRAGFYPSSVHDGETNTRIPAQVGGPESADRVLTLALNLDECRVYFSAFEDHERVGSVVLTFGNDGWDVVSDWSWVDTTAAGCTFNETLDKLDPESVGTAAACKAHTWAWGPCGDAFGACIKCGRSHKEGGTGVVSAFYR